MTGQRPGSEAPGDLTLNAGQQGILLDLLSRGQSSAYVQQLIGEVDEPLDRDRFLNAWQALAERYEVLGSCFEIGAGVPVQSLCGPVSVPVEFEDWSGLDDEAVESYLSAFLLADRQVGFDLSRAPLMRVTVFELAPDRYCFVWTSHHLLFDGRSRHLLLKSLYSSIDGGSDAAIRDHISPSTVRASADRPEEAESAAFWRQAWPLDSDHDSIIESIEVGEALDPGSGSGVIWRSLSGQVVQALNERCDQFSVTQSTMLHAAWALLASRYTGCRWVVSGVTRACRKSYGDGEVGMFVNTLPLAIAVHPDETVGDLLGHARRQWRALSRFELDVISDIVRWRGSRRNLFDVVLNFEGSEPNARLRKESADWHRRHFSLVGSTGLPLTITVYGGSSLHFHLVYDRARIDPSMAEGLADQLLTVLRSFAASADLDTGQISLGRAGPIGDLGGVPAREEYPSVVDCFNETVALHAGRVALKQGGSRLTYAELSVMADRLHCSLRHRGIRRGDRVGLLMSRSSAMVAAWLGILKAGAAYVPLDPAMPGQRIDFILDDAGVNLLLVDSAHSEELVGTEREVVIVDEVLAADLPSGPVQAQVHADDAAYVMYTSGSSGEPKGVVITHRGVVRLVRYGTYVPFSEERVFLHHSTPVFDASTFEVWGPLLNGACCVLAQSDRSDVSELFHLLGQEDVDCLWLTASLFNLIVEEDVRALSSVRYLLVGGESLSVEHVRRALEALPHTQIINGYGPTENTTFTTVFPIPQELAPPVRQIPIGYAIAGTYVDVLDHAGRPVPPGFPGELVIGGDGLSPGYLGRPRVNAAAFIPDPNRQHGGYLYRSGDRCRMRSDGRIDFLGRLDDQIKIRGFRVEPAETAHVLEQHVDVAQAVVLGTSAAGGAPQLEAWVVPAAGRTISAAALQSYARSRLPGYQVPWRIHLIEDFPLTPGGKVDRNRLLELRGMAEQPECADAPSELVLALSALWAESLGVQSCGPRTDYFDSGGDSLSAMRLLRRIESKFGQKLALSQLMESPTPERLAESMTGAGAHGTSPVRREFAL